MRSFLGLIACLLFVLPAHAQNTVTLPIEVYGADGRSVATETVTINATNGSQADRIYFAMHQPFYHLGGWEQAVHDGSFDREAMVDVRLNGGSWVTVRDENVTCAFPEETQGCVASGYATIRFSMNIGAVADGANTLDFRYNGTEGVRSGFRVLYIGLMQTGQTVDGFVPLPKAGATDNLIDGTTFEYWDPDSWTAPAGYEDPSFVSAGEALWSTENTLEDLLGAPMVAACGSCHATDGRDLQYFAFSNETIIARSRSHGLTEDEGKQIAAYIRSLQFTYADGTTPATTNSPGTPWDPPYQPGPTGFGPNKNQHPDEADPYYWAAGAGLDWALDHDSATVKYMFPASGDPANPQGIGYNAAGDLDWERYRIVDGSEWGGNGGTNRGTAMNVREIPVSAQFPDWNNWLTDIHPHDGLDKLFNGSNLESHFDGAETLFASATPEDVRQWQNQANSIFFQDLKLRWNEDVPSTQTDSHNNVLINQHAILGANQWRATKTWYLQHKYNFEDKADERHCDGSPTEWCEPLGWLGSMRTVFDIAPHVAGTDYDRAPYVYGTITDNDFFNHIWYHLQLIVNPGTDGNGGNTPIDEGYQEAFLGGGCDNGFGCGFRQTTSEYKFLQITSNTLNTNKGPRPAHWAHNHIFRALQPDWRKAEYWEPNVDTQAERDLAGDVIEAYFRAANAYMVGENGSEGRIATVERVSSGLDNQGFDWNAITYDPVEDNLPNSKDYTTQIYNALAGNLVGQRESMADWLPTIAAGTIDSLAAQGDLLSPDDRDDGYAGEVTNGWSLPTRWHDFVNYTAPPPPTNLPDPTMRDRGAAPGTDAAVALSDRYVVRAGHGAPGDPSVRHGISDPNKLTVADGETCAFTISNMHRIDDGDQGQVGQLPYHAWAGVCIGDVCTRLYRRGISADIQNVSTGEFGNRLPGQVTIPATVSMTCNGTTCTGTVDGVTVGSVSDPTPSSGGICSTDGEIGERDPAVSSFSIEWSAVPAH